MTKEQLVSLGLTEEQIAEVFKLNGIAVENARSQSEEVKQELETLKVENESLKEQLETANTQIGEFKDKDLNLTQLREKVDQYEKTVESLQEKHKQELTQLTKTQKVTVEALNYNPHSVDDILTFVDLDKVEITDNGVFGLKEQIETIKESKPYLFKEEDKVDKFFKGSDPVDPIKKPGDEPKTYDDFLKQFE